MARTTTELTHKHALEMEALKKKHQDINNGLKKDIEHKYDRQMMDERKSLQKELSVIQTHMDKKVGNLEACVRGVTSESEKYQQKVLELTHQIEMARSTNHQARGAG